MHSNSFCFSLFYSSTPTNPDWRDPWNMLLGNGTIEYLVLNPTNHKDGTYEWTTNLFAGQVSASHYFPNAEGMLSDRTVQYNNNKKIYLSFAVKVIEFFGMWKKTIFVDFIKKLFLASFKCLYSPACFTGCNKM
jgi:hypothetical protein